MPSTGQRRAWASIAYNGGLFADDPVLDRSKCRTRSAPTSASLGDYDYRPAIRRRPTPRRSGNSSLIDVDILGHIFEQSITDLEKLRNELDGPAPKPLRRGKAQDPAQEGRGVLHARPSSPATSSNRRWAGCCATVSSNFGRPTQQAAKGAAKTALADPRVYELDKLKKPERAALVKFWEAWQDELATIRLLDPACGSGAFLIEAFDQLHAAYQAIERSAGKSCAGIARCSTWTSGFWKTTSTAST